MPNHFGVDIAKWTSTIARIDRCIRLNVILVLVGQKLVFLPFALTTPSRERVFELVGRPIAQTRCPTLTSSLFPSSIHW